MGNKQGSFKMLSNLNTEIRHSLKEEAVTQDSRWSRSEEEDLQKAIEHLYEFKRKLDKLHPNCVHLVQTMLQGRY